MSTRPATSIEGHRGYWGIDAAPHLRTPATSARIAWTICAAALPAALGGIVIFGIHSAIIMALCAVTAALGNTVLNTLSRRAGVMDLPHAVMTGLLLALTLPPQVRWEVPVCGALIAILVGKGLLGGQGNYLWSPVLVGRVGLQLLDSRAMLPASWPILGRESLLTGRLDSAADPQLYFGWQESVPAPGADAWLLPRVDALLSSMREGLVAAEAGLQHYAPVHSLSGLLRDVLPPWRDTLLGLTPGGVGETCTICILVGGLYLIHRGYVRWQLPVSILAGAALTAAIFPVAGGEGALRMWFPGLALEHGQPVGMAYVLYHLTSGELMLGAFFVAGDMVCTPLRARGQVIFGFGVGVLTILLRMYGVIPGSCYWAILAMNVAVSTARDTRTE